MGMKFGPGIPSAHAAGEHGHPSSGDAPLSAALRNAAAGFLFQPLRQKRSAEKPAAAGTDGKRGGKAQYAFLVLNFVFF